MCECCDAWVVARLCIFFTFFGGLFSIMALHSNASQNKATINYKIGPPYNVHLILLFYIFVRFWMGLKN